MTSFGRFGGAALGGIGFLRLFLDGLFPSAFLGGLFLGALFGSVFTGSLFSGFVASALFGGSFFVGEISLILL